MFIAILYAAPALDGIGRDRGQPAPTGRGEIARNAVASLPKSPELRRVAGNNIMRLSKNTIFLKLFSFKYGIVTVGTNFLKKQRPFFTFTVYHTGKCETQCAMK